MSVFVRAGKQKLSTEFKNELVTQLQNRSFTSGTMTLDSNSPFYPKRGDEKIMRSDAIMSVIAVQELLQENKITKPLEETALFVASGVFIEDVENHLGHLLKVFENIKDAQDEQEKLRNIYRASPPLLALQTLTNSTMSFVAQYTGIKGNNATFGNSSLSGFHAIQEAKFEAEFKHTPAMAVSSNVGGEFSFIQNSSLLPSCSGWKESAASVVLLLDNQPDAQNLCEIVSTTSSATLEPLLDIQIKRNWAKILPDDTADAIIFSGAYTEEDYTADQKYCQEINSNAYSLFPKYGNMGPSNLLTSLMMGVELFKDGLTCVDLLDRDVYGRESCIRIKAIK